MGIMITLEIMPERISNIEWTQVYEETLKLIGAYPLMDKIVIKDKYSETWVYTKRSKERILHYLKNIF